MLLQRKIMKLNLHFSYSDDTLVLLCFTQRKEVHLVIIYHPGNWERFVIEYSVIFQIQIIQKVTTDMAWIDWHSPAFLICLKVGNSLEKPTVVWWWGILMQLVPAENGTGVYGRVLAMVNCFGKIKQVLIVTKYPKRGICIKVGFEWWQMRRYNNESFYS